MIRITLDLDTLSKIKVSYFFIKSFFIIKNIKKINLIKSNSKGYHLIIWTTEKYKLKEQFKLRERLGDDKTRLRLDKNRTLGRNTLFENKKYFRNFKHFETYFNLNNRGLKNNERRRLLST